MNVVAPFMVQGRVETSVPLSCRQAEAPSHYEDVTDTLLTEETIAVAGIRLTRPDANRTLTIRESELDPSDLKPKRRMAWDISKALIDGAADSGDQSALYLLRDQKQYTPETYADIYHGTIDHTPIFVRSEEGLLYRAQTLIEQVLANTVQNPNTPVSPCEADDHGDCVVRSNEDGGSSHLPLRGYEFNPFDTGAERVRFEHYPSCEVFLAALALEQLEIADGDGVIRICHYSMRNRDTAAKNILQTAGYDHLPIETVALGDDGKPNKIFSWHNDAAVKQSLRGSIREAVQRQQSQQ